MTMGTIIFRNEVQATLWKQEIVGQLSDGFWENARPYDHWKAWARAQVEVGENVGRNFDVVRDRYGLANHDLLDVVGHRMQVYARLCLAFGGSKVEALEHVLDLGGNIQKKAAEDAHTLIIDGINVEVMQKTLAECEASDLFSMKDLRKELRDMSKIMKVYRMAA
jgi:hypothetical protein